MKTGIVLQLLGKMPWWTHEAEESGGISAWLSGMWVKTWRRKRSWHGGRPCPEMKVTRACSRPGVLKLQDLMPNNLRWSWCNNSRYEVHDKYNVLETSWNHASPSSMEKLFSRNLVHGAKKFADCRSRQREWPVENAERERSIPGATEQFPWAGTSVGVKGHWGKAWPVPGAREPCWAAGPSSWETVGPMMLYLQKKCYFRRPSWPQCEELEQNEKEGRVSYEKL